MKNKNKFNKLMGKEFMRFRMSIGYNQDQMATIMGVHQSAVSRIEQGAQSLGLYEAKKIADYFDLSIDVIVGVVHG